MINNYNIENKLERSMWVLHNQIKLINLQKTKIEDWNDVDSKFLE